MIIYIKSWQTTAQSGPFWPSARFCMAPGAAGTGQHCEPQPVHSFTLRTSTPVPATQLVTTPHHCLRLMLFITYLLDTSLLATARHQGVESQPSRQRFSEFPHLWLAAQVEMAGLSRKKRILGSGSLGQRVKLTLMASQVGIFCFVT